MSFSKLLSASMVCVLCVGPIQADSSLDLEEIGGGALLADGVTLVVSQPTKAALVYVNTIDGKETKRANVEFQPSALVVQGKNLFAATKGSAIVHVLDAETGKETGVVKLGGGNVKNLACHPEKGSIWASTDKNEVFGFDASGKSDMAKVGMLVAVDPSNPDVVYGVSCGAFKSILAKCKATGTKLTSTDTLDRPSVNMADAVAVSADGSTIGVVGMGRMLLPSGRSYINQSLFLWSNDVKSKLGEVKVDDIPGPRAVAFHQVLPLGATATGSVCVTFSAKSYVKKQTINATKKGGNVVPILAFVDKGKKLAYGTFTFNGRSTLQIIDLELSKEEQDALAKAIK